MECMLLIYLVLLVKPHAIGAFDSDSMMLIVG